MKDPLAVSTRMRYAKQQVMEMNEIDLNFMREAHALAAAAEVEGEVPIGAVVVHQGQIVGRGQNRKESRPDATAHAEILALQEASRTLGRWRLSGCTLYVTLEPCAMCAGALVSARVDRVVFATSDPKAGALVSLFQIGSDSRLNHQFEIVSGVLGDECSAQLKNFFQRRRRENKFASAEVAVNEIGESAEGEPDAPIG